MASLKPSRRAATWAALTLAPLLCLLSRAWAQSDAEISQQRIEAAYLYKFGGYVTWPDSAFASADSPLVIGVAGNNELAGDLSNLVAGRSIGSHPVVVRRLQAGASLTGIHILFVGNGADDLIGTAHGRPVLVVAEGLNGLQRGADMSFVLVDDRVRFDVALNAVQESGLKLSSALLSVAHNISGTRQGAVP